jgi:alkanesulfonate monooxygenase SsuD/methylene tetrahydromethanopterin reductase-like flavin-dependent oxidoreductase (luciferase family)
MEIVRGLTQGGYFEFHGEFYDVPAIKISPTSTEPIPLLVGGHADRALRRAVVRGDGWMHGGGPQEELDALLTTIAEIRAAEGLTDRPFEIHVISRGAGHRTARPQDRAPEPVRRARHRQGHLTVAFRPSVAGATCAFADTGDD